MSYELIRVVNYTSLGKTTVDVEADSQHKNLPLVIVEGEEAPLFGQNCIAQLDVAWDVLKICTKSVKCMLLLLLVHRVKVHQSAPEGAHLH